MTHPRSYLFVPGHRPDRFTKAAASGADRIIVDLEDAVGPEDKDLARSHVADWFAQGGTAAVRINGADTPWFEADAAATASWPATEIMLPKADTGSLASATRALPARPLIALIETVRGLVDILEIARTEQVARLAFGNLDFGFDARIPGTGATLDPARFQIVIASRQASLPPPIDGVTVAIDDDGELASDVACARRLGFAAKLCIHPRQVGRVNEGFAPSREDIDWARRILDIAGDDHGAVVQVDGKMVDRPVLARATAILAEAQTCPRNR